MRIFISYSWGDYSSAQQILEAIEGAGYDQVTLPNKKRAVDIDKDNPFAAALMGLGDEKKNKSAASTDSKSFSEIEAAILETDVSIIVYSRKYEVGAFSEREMHTILTNAALNKRKRVIVFALDHARRSVDLEQHELVYASEDFEGGVRHLLRLLERANERLSVKDNKAVEEEAIAHDADELNKRIIEKLRSAFRQGSLTLVAGAGISFDAKVPDWDQLLDDLLNRMIIKHTGDGSTSSAANDADIGELKNRSSLIIGQYLKNSLKGDFLEELRSALYKDVLKSSPIIDAICEISKPRRAGNDLDSIITFNFDDLLEQNLATNGVPYREIYKEGERAGSSEIPIYHVHGFLPMNGDIATGMNVVFSEDAYHDQFIDPFSWSNLIQLSKYGQNTCLFVGLSLSDPNLRRLLDVSNRKETDRENRHYIIQKRKDATVRNTLIETLQEQDAAGLGLGLIWVNRYEEIPDIIREVSA